MDSFQNTLIMDEFILAVDDNIENLKLLGSALKEQGYRIAMTQSGQETIELAKTLTPTLILLDVMMPEMDGFELAKRLRQIDNYKDIPIIFLTARDQTEDIIRGFESGGTDYLTKPFNWSELKARIKNQIDLKKAKDKIAAQAVEVQKLNNFQNRIFSVIGHDMRTPLASMTMLLTNFKTETASFLSENQLNYLNLIEILTGETFQMLDNMFHWARYQLNTITPVKVSYNINEQVLKTILLFKATADQKNIAITFNNKETVPVYADENMILSVMRNLLNNAIKYSHMGSEIVIRTETDEEKTSVFFKDNGVGLDPEELQNAFSDFDFQSTPGTAGEKGTGLGLKICSYFINLNGGKLEASSTKGGGSEFHFSLSVKQN